MQIVSSFNAILIGAREAGEGKNGKYYNISLEQNDASTEIGCTEEVFKTVKSGAIPKYSQVTMFAGYNTQYGSYRIIEICPFSEEKKK